MVQEPLRLSRTSTEKMKLHSQSSTRERSPNHVLIVVSVEQTVEEEQDNAVGEANYKNLVDEEVPVEVIREDDGVKDSVDEDLAGKIMINLNAFGTRLFKLNLSGNCLKNSSSTNYRKWLLIRLLTEKMCKTSCYILC
jgi:hypothetical protein